MRVSKPTSTVAWDTRTARVSNRARPAARKAPIWVSRRPKVSAGSGPSPAVSSHSSPWPSSSMSTWVAGPSGCPARAGAGEARRRSAACARAGAARAVPARAAGPRAPRRRRLRLPTVKGTYRASMRGATAWMQPASPQREGAGEGGLGGRAQQRQPAMLGPPGDLPVHEGLPPARGGRQGHRSQDRGHGQAGQGARAAPGARALPNPGVRCPRRRRACAAARRGPARCGPRGGRC